MDKLNNEMLNLVREISLYEHYPLYWDIEQLDKVKYTLQGYSNQVDQYLQPLHSFNQISINNFNNADSILSERQIQELFSVNDCYCRESLSNSIDLENAYQSQNSNHNNSSFNETSDIFEDSKDTILQLKTKLLWYKSKIDLELNNPNSEKLVSMSSSTLALLIDLAEFVSSILQNVDLVVQELDNQDTTTVQLLTSSTTSNNKANEMLINTKQVNPKISPKVSSKFSGVNPQVEDIFPAVSAIVYALRRGGDRQETLCLVNKLMTLCNLNTQDGCASIHNFHGDAAAMGQFQLNLIRQMMTAGIVQALLSTLSRAHDWPEVEKNISIVLSILITYEDDWNLLQRSAGIILTALYTLQVKSIVTLKGTTQSMHQYKQQQESNLLIDNCAQTQDEVEDMNKQKTEHDELKGLLAAAVAKLSLVLASEWGKLEIPLAMSSGAFGIVMNESTGITLNSSQVLPNATNSNRNSRNFSKANNSVPVVDNERILQILLNLIQTLCDDFLNEFTMMLQLQNLAFNRIPAITNVIIIPPKIDKTVIQCSLALYSLAEIPQCRPGLVSSGALKLIKALLEVGTQELSTARSKYLDIPLKDSINKIAYFDQFGPVYELVSNAAAALMFISGGIDYRRIKSMKQQIHAHSNSSHFPYGNGGRDYVVGWIDAQILSEGLPMVVVNMIHKSMEAFTSVQAETQPTRSILPAAISMHLVQTLYQLYSRPQNRQQLQSIDIPHALCILFENITSQMKIISEQNNSKDSFGGIYRPVSPTNIDVHANTMFQEIFHYGIDSPKFGSTSKMFSNTKPFNYSARTSLIHEGTNQCESPSNTSQNIADEYELHTSHLINSTSKQLSDDVMAVLSSVASSCLDVLSCFFVNEMQNMVPFSPSHSTSKIASSNMQIAKSVGYNFSIRTRTPSLSLGNPSTAIFYSVSELICHKRFVGSIKTASSLLPRGRGRLSTIRIISALTDSPDALIALFEGGIMEILMTVSSEEAELQAKSQAAAELREAQKSNQKGLFIGLEAGNSFFQTIFPVKPSGVERTVSGASSLSGLSSATSNHQRTASKYVGGNHFINEDEEEDENDANYFEKTIVIEETHQVCNSLANLCEAKESYAQYLFSKDMFKVMLQLVRTNHMEISRQALRCISAMCKNVIVVTSSDEISMSDTDKRRGNSPFSKESGGPNSKIKSSNNSTSIFSEALDVLSQCIRSPSSLIQRDATYTISLLALSNEKLQDRIVYGPLRTIVSLMIDPTVDRSIRAVAEDVLRNLGFLSGVKDFELCGYDFEILKDWYIMKRSLKHQDLALVILQKWIDRLFEDEDLSQQSSEFGLHHHLHDSIVFSNELAQEAISIINEVRENATTHSANCPIKNFLRRESESNLGTSNGNMNGTKQLQLNSNSEIKSNSDKVNGSKSITSIPTFQRHFTETVRRFLPFFSKTTEQLSPDATEPVRSNSSEVVPVTQLMDRGDRVSNTTALPNTLNTSPVAPTSCSLGNLGSFAGLAAGLAPGNVGLLTGINYGNLIAGAIDETYDWLDRPPSGILHLLDLFYSSRLHQMLLMDLTSIGVILSPHQSSPLQQESNDDGIDSSSFDILNSSGTVLNEENHFSVDFESFYVLPRPHSVTSIILPSRTYQSFTRVGRVIEKMVEYSSDQNKMWSLLFRDSDYMGDFHTSLLSTLRKCPQICSLSFASTQRVEEDALLGHLVGQIPPSIRFLSFKSTLSRESIQALCILLRTHNAAFSVRDNDNLANNSIHSRSVLHDHNNDVGLLKRAIISNDGNSKASNSKTSKTISNRGKGLLGLALTHLTFDNAEINYIIELLQRRGPKPSQRHSGTTKSTENPTGVSVVPLSRNRSVSDSTPQSPESISSPSSMKSNTITSFSTRKEKIKGGIRFLDLSYNSLSDFTCYRLLSGAFLGPLEGLELRGNSIGRAIKFAEAMDFFSATKMIDCRHRLRHLGLSHNYLTSKAVSSILEPLISNCTLTSLDLSDNEIDHSKEFNDTIRTFIRLNTGLRQLDLCNNRLNADTFKEVHLGLLENDSLLMLPLAGNYAVDKSPTISLIQIKLRENRMLYKSQAQTEYGDVVSQQGNLAAYQSEEELGQRISMTNNLNAISILLDETSDETASDRVPTMAPAVILGDLNIDISSQQNNDSSMVALDLLSVRDEMKLDNSVSNIANSSKPDCSYDQHRESMNQNKNISIAIAVPIIDRSRAFSHDSLSPADKTIPIVRTYSDTRDNHYVTQKASGVKSFFENQGNLQNDNGTAAAISEDKITAAAAKNHNSLMIATSDLFVPGNISSFDEGSIIPPSTPYEQFSHNTLNVLFSCPLAGFDSKKKPHPLEVLDYNAERELLMQVFKEVHRDVSVHFDFATTDALRTALSLGCKALHFSGHGFPKGLCFEDGRSGLQIIRVPQLKDLLGAGGLNLKFVFVSACYSMEIGEAFVKAGVPHVVCVKINTKVQDAAAISFTRAFYVAFLSGKTVQASFSIAKEALKVSPYVADSLLEVNKFILLPDYSSSDSSSENNDVQHHSKSIFVNKQLKSEWPIPAKHCTIGSNRLDVKAFYQARSKLPNPPADFEGREVVVHLLIRSVLERRLVSLVGADGMGKSSVAAAACKYLSDREAFPDSIIYFKAKKGSDYRMFLNGLQHSILTSGITNIMSKMQALLSSQSDSRSTLHLVYPEEENIISCLETSRMLLVLDNIDDLVADYDESHADFRLFLGRIFEQCPFVKVLVAVVDTLSMHNITVGFGIVEYSVPLGPLSLHSSLRLFAKLAPSLGTSMAKKEFINALQPARHISVSVDSQDINSTAMEILHLFGDGHPSKIVYMACESTSEKVEYLKQTGMKIISENSTMMDMHSVSSYQYSIQSSVSGLK